MRRLSIKLFLLVLVITGTWQLGQGLYIHLKAMLAQELLEQAWRKTQQGEEQVKPWSWADTWPVAKLKVPRLDVNLIVLAGDSGRTLAFGPGHNFASSKLGKVGNSFISGHRDTHFRFLKDLQRGDRLLLETPDGQVISYVVELMRVTHAQNTRVVIDAERSRLSLITCYPFDTVLPNGPQRYLVSAIQQLPAKNNPMKVSTYQGNRHDII